MDKPKKIIEQLFSEAGIHINGPEIMSWISAAAGAASRAMPPKLTAVQ